MNQPSPTDRMDGAWVRLYLVPQTESTDMPPYIEGYLSTETPSAYVLTKTIETQEDEETYDIKRVEVDGMEFINRTYVWRCSILPRSPVDDGDGSEGAFLLESGGMG